MLRILAWPEEIGQTEGKINLFYATIAIKLIYPEQILCNTDLSLS